jgi:hypothetical protein
VRTGATTVAIDARIVATGARTAETADKPIDRIDGAAQTRAASSSV